MILGNRTFYKGALDIPPNTSGEFSIKHTVAEGGTEFSTTSARTAIMGGHKGERITFRYPTVWHSLTDSDGVWMTDYPIEQFQADSMLHGNVYGTVLIGGLGLGYAAQLIASQPRVDKIIVVEKSQNVKDLVWRHLDFPKRIETHIVIDDLFHYLEQPQQCPIHCGFYDIWRGDGESTFHETVIPLRKLSSTVVSGPIYCWNEDIMRCQLLMSLLTRTMGLYPDIDQEASNRLERRDWMIPYFKAVKDKVFEPNDRDSIVVYVNLYGRPDLDDSMQSFLVKGWY